jgi:hypothetical protein
MRLLENRARATFEKTRQISTARICGGSVETGLSSLVVGRSANLQLAVATIPKYWGSWSLGWPAALIESESETLANYAAVRPETSKRAWARSFAAAYTISIACCDGRTIAGDRSNRMINNTGNGKPKHNQQGSSADSKYHSRSPSRIRAQRADGERGNGGHDLSIRWHPVAVTTRAGAVPVIDSPTRSHGAAGANRTRTNQAERSSSACNSAAAAERTARSEGATRCHPTAANCASRRRTPRKS